LNSVSLFARSRFRKIFKTILDASQADSIVLPSLNQIEDGINFKGIFNCKAGADQQRY